MVIILILGFVYLLKGIYKFWAWRRHKMKSKKAELIINELTQRKIPKLTKDEQFDFLDGKSGWSKIQNILGLENIPLGALEYFIDIEPDEYLNHLKKNNPPSSWFSDIYSETVIKKIKNGYEIKYYYLGNETSYEIFDNYDQLLRYLVYKKLTSISYKYKMKLKKSYYS